MLWGTLDNLDMNTSHPVLTVRPDSSTLQAILQYLSRACTQQRGFRGRGKAGYTSGSTVTKQTTGALQFMVAFALRWGGGSPPGNISHFVVPWEAGGPSPNQHAPELYHNF